MVCVPVDWPTRHARAPFLFLEKIAPRFGHYPQRHEAEILGTSPLDRCLNVFRKHGLRMGAKCMLPFGPFSQRP